jgi:hypothetical protein
MTELAFVPSASFFIAQNAGTSVLQDLAHAQMVMA